MPKHVRRLTPSQAGEQARIRAALREEIERSTLRAVARCIPMSPTGLQGFLDGTIPYGPTLERLRDWFLSWRNGAGMAADDADQSRRRLLRWLPDQDAGMAVVVDAIEAVHRAATIARPPWLTELRSRYRAERDHLA
jgi:hypothetical protein